METDRRAIAAVAAAVIAAVERALGRIPEAQAHSNPGFDVLSIDPVPDAHEEPTVNYLVEPFQDVTLHFAQTKLTLNVAQTKLTLNVADLLTAAGPPR